MKLDSLLLEGDIQDDLEDALELLTRLNEKVKDSDAASDLTFVTMEIDSFLERMNGDPDMEYDEPYGYQDNYMDDGDALASAGMGTDEDYGSYGGDEW